MAIQEQKSPPRDGPGEAASEEEHASPDANDANGVVHAEQLGLLGRSATDDGAPQPSASEEAPPDAGAPNQFGYKRYVYAAYFTGAIGVAFFVEKAVSGLWMRLAQWKPAFGEPHDDVVMPIAALIGAGVAIYYFKQARTRQLAEEVASELSKVTWPTRTEVTNNTFVVVVTTAVATIFFALMDRFWGFVTNLVYGT